jgi:hypothetical protein
VDDECRLSQSFDSIDIATAPPRVPCHKEVFIMEQIEIVELVPETWGDCIPTDW